MTRDSQRQRVYDAEVAAFGGTLLDEPMRWDALVAVVDALAHHPWWLGLGLDRPEVVAARSDSRRSTSDGRTIRLAAGGRTPLTVAHEMAHHLVAALHGPHVEAHGPTFRAAELRTVAVIGGTDARRVLANEWRRWGLPPGPWPHAEPPDGPGLALSGVVAL